MDYNILQNPFSEDTTAVNALKRTKLENYLQEEIPASTEETEV